MSRKKLITILATITMTATLMFPMLISSAAVYDADNMIVTGVLASDSYVLYPYAKENLIFGFSKYGELINGEAKQGLEYDGMDVFANPDVLEKDWSQGWFIDIHYADLANHYKRAWAFALYSDISGSTGIGKDWQEACTEGPLGAPYGGRKTNVWAATDDIKVLYDGPRRFVALTKTILYDDQAKGTDDALVSVTITFVFNKVKKNVVLYKDIKRLDKGKFGRKFQVEFSNRGEWDIGTTAAPPSYAHFYDNLYTYYDHEYHDFYNATNDITGYDLAQMIDEGGDYVGFAAFWPQLFGKMVDGTTHITRDTILESLCTQEYNQTWEALGSFANRTISLPDLGWPTSDPYPVGLGEVSDEPMVYLNDVLLTEGVDYDWTGDATDSIVFLVEPADTDQIIVVYKHETPVGGALDDMSNHVAEPDTPYVIGEWCFILENKDRQRQFRAVTMYGVTDRHDADDDDAEAEDWSMDANTIDDEVGYQLDETFVPFDLWDAVRKDTRRWVDFHNVTTVEETAELVWFNLTHTWVFEADWTEYCSFAEKVQWDGELRTPARASDLFGGYNYTLTNTGPPDYVGGILITGDNVPPAGTEIKVLYSTVERKEKIDLITIDEANSTSYQLSHWPVWLNPDRFGASGILVIKKSDGESPPTIVDTTNYTIDEMTGILNFTISVTAGEEYNAIYEIWGGSYEWMVVGTVAATIDSAGAAYVTEAFDSIKNVDVKMTGMDIKEATWGPNSPFVMGRGNTRDKADYRDTLGRPHLRDDWCHTTPVSSSNMIFEGGPIAQLGTEYFNEFTYAFFARSAYVTTDIGHKDKILGLSCWNKTIYGSGHAVISVYKDINGTVGFLVWGYDGDDTYYASKWLWDGGIVYLQCENWGVTDIILEIDYPEDDPTHPEITIVERLGTISEKTPHDC